MEEKQNMGGTQNVAQKSTPTPAQSPATPVVPVKTSAAPAPVAPSVAPATKPKTEEPNMMTQGVSAKKKGKGAILGMILLGILAVGGISFGVWEMLDANTQKEQLNSQISTLKQQNNELQGKLSEATSKPTDTTDSASAQQNPIVKSNSSDEEYSFSYNSTIDTDSNIDYISIRIKDGDVSGCSVGHKEYTGANGGYTVKDISECDVTGLNGKIYKVVGFWAGQMKMNENIGFIMQDGTVQYFDFNNAVANNDFSVKNLNIDGFVVDALDMEVGSTGSSAGGYVATVFVLSDGSNVKYTESML